MATIHQSAGGGPSSATPRRASPQRRFGRSSGSSLNSSARSQRRRATLLPRLARRQRRLLSAVAATARVSTAPATSGDGGRGGRGAPESFPPTDSPKTRPAKPFNHGSKPRCAIASTAPSPRSPGAPPPGSAAITSLATSPRFETRRSGWPSRRRTLYIAESQNYVIRKFSTAVIITTIAVTPHNHRSQLGDGGSATRLCSTPQNPVFDAAATCISADYETIAFAKSDGRIITTLRVPAMAASVATFGPSSHAALNRPSIFFFV